MSLHRLAPGTLTEAVILGSSTYLVTNFPDATNGKPWIVGHNNIVRPYIMRAQTLANTDSMFGKLNFLWLLGVLNDDQWDYLYNDIFGGLLTAVVTVVTRNRLFDPVVANQWVAINCKARLPELDGTGLNPRQGTFYSPVQIQFFDGVYAAES